MVRFVKKRDGRIIPFNEDRITRAIFLAAEKVAKKEEEVPDYNLSEQLEKHTLNLKISKFLF